MLHKDRAIRNLRRRTALVALEVALASGIASAHDVWLVPDVFAVPASGDIVVTGQTRSAFPTTQSAVTPDRVTEARVIGAADAERIAALSTHDNSLVLRHRPKTPGQKIIAVAAR